MGVGRRRYWHRSPSTLISKPRRSTIRSWTKSSPPSQLNECVLRAAGADIGGHLPLVGASDQMLKTLAYLTGSYRAVEVQGVIVIHLSARTESSPVRCFVFEQPVPAEAGR